jgi:hypothetical protein
MLSRNDFFFDFCIEYSPRLKLEITASWILAFALPFAVYEGTVTAYGRGTSRKKSLSDIGEVHSFSPNRQVAEQEDEQARSSRCHGLRYPQEPCLDEKAAATL